MGAQFALFAPLKQAPGDAEFRLHLRQVAVLAQKALIDPVFQPPDPAALEKQLAPGGDCAAVAEIEHGEGAALRGKTAKPPAGGVARQIAGERLALANRVNAGLGALLALDRRRVAGDENEVVAR